MGATSLDLSQIKTDVLSAASTFRTLIGLGNVNNTADLDKPISTATQAALDLKANSSDLSSYLPLTGGTLTGGLSGTTGSFSGNISGYNGTFSSAVSAYTIAANAGRAFMFNHFNIAAGFGYTFSPNSSGGNGYEEIGWYRDATRSVCLSSGANASRLNIYGTYTDASNYRRFYISSTTGGAFTLGVEGLGTGASGNTLSVAGTLAITGVATAPEFNSQPLNGQWGLSVNNTGGKVGFYRETNDYVYIRVGTTNTIQFHSGGSYFFGNLNGSFVGVNAFGPGSSPTNRLTVNGNTSIGAGVMSTAAPTNGLLVQGNIISNSRITTPSILLSGNFSSTAWTTNGVGIAHTARTLTDTSSTGTVAAAYTNVLGGNTIAASNATTYTDYASLFLGSPTAGTNVTITNSFSLITAGAARFGGKITAPATGQASTGGIGNGSNGIDFFQGVIVYNNSAIAPYPAYFCDGQSTSKLKFHPNTELQWDAGDPTATRNNGDLRIARDAANTWAQRNGANAQAWRLYGTFTDASNYRRLYISSTTAGAFTLGVEGLGTGASGNTLNLVNDLYSTSAYRTSSGFGWKFLAAPSYNPAQTTGLYQAGNGYHYWYSEGSVIMRWHPSGITEVPSLSVTGAISGGAGTFSGNVTTSRVVFNASNNMYIRDNGSGLILSYYGGELFRFGYGEFVIDLSGQGSLRFGSNTVINCQNGGLTVVHGGTTSQSWRVANTYTDASNFRTLNLSWSNYSAVNYGRVGIVNAGTGVADCPLVLSPSGTGAFILGPMPDGTSTGGNARGANAIDLQLLRSSASQVASGQGSVTLGQYNTASHQATLAFGILSNSSGWGAVSIGDSCWSSGDVSFSIGRYAVANKYAQFSHSGWRFASSGDSQFARFILSNRTTNATPTVLFTRFDESRRLTIDSGKMFLFEAKIIGVRSDGLQRASYMRKGTIINVAGSTSLVGVIETIGTDVEDNPALDMTITADDANDALAITVTGITGETWRWVAVVEGVEVAYGT